MVRPGRGSIFGQNTQVSSTGAPTFNLPVFTPRPPSIPAFPNAGGIHENITNNPSGLRIPHPGGIRIPSNNSSSNPVGLRLPGHTTNDPVGLRLSQSTPNSSGDLRGPGNTSNNSAMTALVPNVQVQQFSAAQLPTMYAGQHYQSPTHIIECHSISQAQGIPTVNYNSNHFHNPNLPPSPRYSTSNQWSPHHRETNYPPNFNSSHSNQLPPIAQNGQHLATVSHQDIEELHPSAFNVYGYPAYRGNKKDDNISGSYTTLNDVRSSPVHIRSDSCRSSSGSRDSLDSISTGGLSTPKDSVSQGFLLFHAYVLSGGGGGKRKNFHTGTMYELNILGNGPQAPIISRTVLVDSHYPISWLRFPILSQFLHILAN